MAKPVAKRVKIPDAAGVMSSHFQLENGMLLFTDSFDVDALKDMKIRDDDVMLISYPRSGCHWLWEQLRMLLAGTTDLPTEHKQSTMLEMATVEEMDPLPSPRILNTHIPFRDYPPEILSKKIKLVFIYRNPKDVAVSFYRLVRQAPWWEYKGEFRNWLKNFMEGKVDYGGYPEFMNDWAKEIKSNPGLNIHILTYEGLHQKPLEELGKLSKFLGKDYDANFLQSVTEACHIDRLRDLKGDYWKDKNVDGDHRYFMYRQGKTNGWKDHFTVTMDEQFDKYWADAFKASDVFPFQQ